MEATVYKLKKFTKKTDLEKLGFVKGEDNENEYNCKIKQPMNGELYQSTINGIYGNEEWKKRYYKGNEDMFKDMLGLEYDKKGRVIESAQLIEILQTWNVQVDFKEKILAFTSSDPFDGKVYIQSVVLDTYCKELIDKMKELDLIETKGFRIKEAK